MGNNTQAGNSMLLTMKLGPSSLLCDTVRTSEHVVGVDSFSVAVVK